MVQNMWVFYLFIPIPIASIVFGFRLKKRGYRYKKNVIIGFIMAILLLIYGSFSFIFANEYSHDEALAKETEELLSIDLPEYYRIDTKDFSGYTQSSSYGHIYTVSNIYFDEAAVREFEESLEDDAKWLACPPTPKMICFSVFSALSMSPKEIFIILFTSPPREMLRIKYPS